MSSGGGKQTTYNKPTQKANYKNLLAQADAGLANGFYDPTFAGGADTYAGQSDLQRELYDRITGSGGALNLGMSALEKTLGPYDPNNAALTGAIDAAAGDVTRNLQENLLPGIGDAATGAGQFGGSRHGIAQGVALRGASEQIGDMAATMRLQDMQAWQGNQQNAMANLGAITGSMEGAAATRQQEVQNQLDDLFAKWQYESGIDLNELMAYKGLISGDMGGKSKGKADGGK